MKSNEDRIFWCLRQKRGIRLEKPSEDLYGAYINKANGAINMLSSALEKEEADWIATTAYYARYFSFYALLMKCGIKSEIHECTISLFQFLFVEEKIADIKLFNEFKSAKEYRIDTQYFVMKTVDNKKLKLEANKAVEFVEISESLTDERIRRLRDKL
ncbi:MAG: HEPN domain-containing protein [Nanoarchaeota archaeon]